MHPLERHHEVSLIDVLDRVLDKGIVIEGQAHVFVLGIDLVEVGTWVVVASIQTYLHYADSLGLSARLPGAEDYSAAATAPDSR